MSKLKMWECKIGEIDEDALRKAHRAADAPMREAVEKAFTELTGLDNAFCFSGWGSKLPELERSIVEKTPTDWHKVRNEWLGEAAGCGIPDYLTEILKDWIDGNKEGEEDSEQTPNMSAVRGPVPESRLRRLPRD